MRLNIWPLNIFPRILPIQPSVVAATPIHNPLSDFSDSPVRSTVAAGPIPGVFKSYPLSSELRSEEARLLEAIWRGEELEPSADILHEKVKALLQSADRRWNECKEAEDFREGRKILWGILVLLSRVVRPEEIREMLWELHPDLARYFPAWRGGEDTGLESERDLTEVIQRLRQNRMIGSPESPDEAPLPLEEISLYGKSDYSRQILKPAFRKGLNYVQNFIVSYGPDPKKQYYPWDHLERLLEDIVAEYQKRRGLQALTPKIVPLSEAVVATLADHPELNQNPQMVDRLLQEANSVTKMMARWIATLPKDIFEKFEVQIARDFPEAFYYREGLCRDVEIGSIAAALAFREEDRRVMHVGIRGDLEIVRHSLRQLPPNGKIVLVDTMKDYFLEYRQDPEIGKAMREGRVVTLHADYLRDEELHRDWEISVDRLYLLHPVGDPLPFIDRVMSGDGLVIYQQTSDYLDWRYLAFERPMVVERDYERIAGYVNGPSQFRTNMAGHLSHLGIRFSVLGKKGRGRTLL